MRETPQTALAEQVSHELPALPESTPILHLANADLGAMAVGKKSCGYTERRDGFEQRESQKLRIVRPGLEAHPHY
ncbi:MAG TPA: hypothetical protein VFW28_18325 [Micropepsaceae bacterium]|nr:hypothetical protein [Micropepsaceae bacterium]